MNLSPEQINEFLAKSILESQIGQVVKDAVARTVASLSKSYDNPFDQVIRIEVNRLINAEIETTYKPILQTGIKAAMEKYITDDVVQKIIDAGLEKLRNSRY